MVRGRRERDQNEQTGPAPNPRETGTPSEARQQVLQRAATREPAQRPSQEYREGDSELSDNEMPQIRPDQNLHPKFFLTANYKNHGGRPQLLEDMRKLQNFVETKKDTEDVPLFALAVAWEEVSPSKHTPHWHAILVLTRGRMRYSKLASVLSEAQLAVRPNIKLCDYVKGAYEYRFKPGKVELWREVMGDAEPQFFLVGDDQMLRDASHQIRRDPVKRALDQCSNVLEFATKYPDVAARALRVANLYYLGKYADVPREEAPVVIWIYGGPGTGKTRACHLFAEQVAQDDLYVHIPGNLKWWDGYYGQKCVVVDDFRRDQLKECGGLSYLLRIIDRYAVTLEVKGGSTVLTAEYILITCPYDPVAAFTYRREDRDDVVDENIGQLIRRLTQIVELRIVDGVVTEFDKTALFRHRHLHNGGEFVFLDHLDIIGRGLERGLGGRAGGDASTDGRAAGIQPGELDTEPICPAEPRTPSVAAEPPPLRTRPRSQSRDTSPMSTPYRREDSITECGAPPLADCGGEGRDPSPDGSNTSLTTCIAEPEEGEDETEPSLGGGDAPLLG